LNRQSTTRWTHLRSGLNNAATTSVEAATPTGEETGNTLVARVTIPT